MKIHKVLGLYVSVYMGINVSRCPHRLIEKIVIKIENEKNEKIRKIRA